MQFYLLICLLAGLLFRKPRFVISLNEGFHLEPPLELNNPPGEVSHIRLYPCHVSLCPPSSYQRKLIRIRSAMLQHSRFYEEKDLEYVASIHLRNTVVPLTDPWQTAHEETA